MIELMVDGPELEALIEIGDKITIGHWPPFPQMCTAYNDRKINIQGVGRVFAY